MVVILHLNNSKGCQDGWFNLSYGSISINSLLGFTATNLRKHNKYLVDNKWIECRLDPQGEFGGIWWSRLPWTQAKRQESQSLRKWFSKNALLWKKQPWLLIRRSIPRAYRKIERTSRKRRGHLCRYRQFPCAQGKCLKTHSRVNLMSLLILDMTWIPTCFLKALLLSVFSPQYIRLQMLR